MAGVGSLAGKHLNAGYREVASGRGRHSLGSSISTKSQESQMPGPCPHFERPGQARWISMSARTQHGPVARAVDTQVQICWIQWAWTGLRRWACKQLQGAADGRQSCGRSSSPGSDWLPRLQGTSKPASAVSPLERWPREKVPTGLHQCQCPLSRYFRPFSNTLGRTHCPALEQAE